VYLKTFAETFGGESEEGRAKQPEEAHPYRQVLQLAMRVRVELLRVPDPSPFGVADHVIAVLLPRLFGRVEGT
jgi:hypothetical protein